MSGVELLGQHFLSTEPAYIRQLRDAIGAAGSHVVNLPVSVGASLYDPDPARRALAASSAKKWVDIAVLLDCHSIRVHVQKVEGVAPNAASALECLRDIAGYGERNGIVVNLENDDPASEDAFFICEIIDRVHGPWVRALPDFCNSMLPGDEDFNYRAVTAMFRRAYNISHVKDSEVDGAKTFRVDLARTFAIAKAAGYKGYFSIEWEGAGDVWEENGKLIDQSLKLLAG